MTVKLTRTEQTFVDISLTFTPNPLTGDLSVIRDSRAIQNSVKNLVLIRPGEVPFNRDIGSTISRLLFDFCDEITGAEIKAEIERTIAFNEPRVEIRELKVVPKPEQNAYDMTLIFNIVGYMETFTINEILTSTR